MHPALSVILFTTLSGSGYGLLALLGMHLGLQPLPFGRDAALATFGFALVLVTVGLLSSLAHLGRPRRAWRALSQWRTSWLSREGVAAIVCYVPALAAAWLAAEGAATPALRVVVGVGLALASLATIACTAMIYASLPPIAAWRDRAVLPGYVGYGLFCGALWLGAALAFAGVAPSPWAAAALAAGAAALALLKHGYWRRVDALGVPAAAAAIGLPGLGTVRSFERPHTEANYLLREMGYVLARRHARRLRALALGLGLALPVLGVAIASFAPALAVAGWLFAALAAQLGALCERWLFFAQAKHAVTSYYGYGDAAR